MIDKIIMWLCHIMYKRYSMPIFYIKGYKEDIRSIYYIQRTKIFINKWIDFEQK